MEQQKVNNVYNNHKIPINNSILNNFKIILNEFNQG